MMASEVKAQDPKSKESFRDSGQICHQGENKGRHSA